MNKYKFKKKTNKNKIKNKNKLSYLNNQKQINKFIDKILNNKNKLRLC